MFFWLISRFLAGSWVDKEVAQKVGQDKRGKGNMSVAIRERPLPNAQAGRPDKANKTYETDNVIVVKAEELKRI